VIDLLPLRYRDRVVPVGRLDWETEGLMLLTDDGDLAHRVAHPRFGCEKVYEVKVKGEPERAAIAKLAHGIRLDGRLTAPARIERVKRSFGPREVKGNTWWRVTLNEGRTRQIREMFFRIGHPVARLRRVAIGPVRDAHLAAGSWRELTDAEVEALRRKTAKRTRRKPPPKPGSRPKSARPAVAKKPVRGKGRK
jgi:23S rRNA pseudouridine2605 synthase